MAEFRYNYPISIPFNPPHELLNLKPRLNLLSPNAFDVLRVISSRPFLYVSGLVHSLHNYTPWCLALLMMLFISMANYIILFIECLIDLIIKIIKSFQLNNNLTFLFSIIILFCFVTSVSAFSPNITKWVFELKGTELWGNHNNTEIIRISSNRKILDFLLYAKAELTAKNNVSPEDNPSRFQYFLKVIWSLFLGIILYFLGFVIYLILVWGGKYLVKLIQYILLGLAKVSQAQHMPFLPSKLRYLAEVADDLFKWLTEAIDTNLSSEQRRVEIRRRWLDIYFIITYAIPLWIISGGIGVCLLVTWMPYLL